MRRTRDVASLVRKLKLGTSSRLDERVHRAISESLADGRQTIPGAMQPNTRRLSMRKTIKNVGMAAAVVVVATLCVLIFEGSTRRVWAVGDTVRAMERFDAIYVSGEITVPLKDMGGGEQVVIKTSEKKTPVELWAQANKERTESGNLRLETMDGFSAGVYDMNSYKYDPNSNTFWLGAGKHIKMQPWPGTGWLKHLEQEAFEDLETMYGTDPGTGRDIVMVRCSFPPQGQSWCVEIDLETRLPVRFKGWNNTAHEGVPSMDVSRIIYFKELPPERFRFEIPEGATVIEEWQD